MKILLQIIASDIADQIYKNTYINLIILQVRAFKSEHFGQKNYVEFFLIQFWLNQKQAYK